MGNAARIRLPHRLHRRHVVVHLQEEWPLRQHPPRTRAANGGPYVLALLEVGLEKGTVAIGLEPVAFDHQLHRIEPAALNVRIDDAGARKLDAAHATVLVVGIAARQRPWRDKTAKRFFSEHGAPNERRSAAIPTKATLDGLELSVFGLERDAGGGSDAGDGDET